MDHLLAGAAARGFRPGTVIDVGASDGVWSLGARRHFPDAAYLLFEPLAEHAAALATLQTRHGFIPVAAAAGERRGQLDFRVAEDLDGSGVAPAGTTGARRVPTETVAEAVRARGLRGPFCLKLDTHGHELPVLLGASDLFPELGLLVIESYNFQLTPGSLRFFELCAWLEQRGFRCCDLADPLRRPRDGLLWQMDLAFAPAASPWFATDTYR
jgi:FkbM family methyltransferase